MELDLNRLCSKEALLAEMETMNSFGTRLTGAKGQTDFVRYLRKRIEDYDRMSARVRNGTCTKEFQKRVQKVKEDNVRRSRELAKAYPLAPLLQAE